MGVVKTHPSVIAPCGAGAITTHSALWRDRQAHDLMLFDEACDEARGFYLFDEGVQEGCTGGVLARRADGLLHGRELAIEDTRAGHLGDVGKQPWLQAGQRIEATLGKQLVGAVDAIGAHQLGMLDVAIEPEAVGAAAHHGDAVALGVDIGDRLQL